jgi:hypothetical protein
VLVRLFIISIAILFLVAGCSNDDSSRQEILKTLATRSNALNTKDSNLYFSTVSLRYSDKGKNFAQLKESVEKNFREFEQISYKCGAPSITVYGSEADSACDYRMKMRVRGKEFELKGLEHLKLKNETDGWKIVSGI